MPYILFHAADVAIEIEGPYLEMTPQQIRAELSSVVPGIENTEWSKTPEGDIVFTKKQGVKG